MTTRRLPALPSPYHHHERYNCHTFETASAMTRNWEEAQPIPLISSRVLDIRTIRGAIDFQRLGTGRVCSTQAYVVGLIPDIEMQPKEKRVRNLIPARKFTIFSAIVHPRQARFGNIEEAVTAMMKSLRGKVTKRGYFVEGGGYRAAIVQKLEDAPFEVAAAPSPDDPTKVTPMPVSVGFMKPNTEDEEEVDKLDLDQKEGDSFQLIAKRIHTQFIKWKPAVGTTLPNFLYRLYEDWETEILEILESHVPALVRPSSREDVGQWVHVKSPYTWHTPQCLTDQGFRRFDIPLKTFSMETFGLEDNKAFREDSNVNVLYVLSKGENHPYLETQSKEDKDFRTPDLTSDLAEAVILQLFRGEAPPEPVAQTHRSRSKSKSKSRSPGGSVTRGREHSRSSKGPPPPPKDIIPLGRKTCSSAPVTPATSGSTVQIRDAGGAITTEGEAVLLDINTDTLEGILKLLKEVTDPADQLNQQAREYHDSFVALSENRAKLEDKALNTMKVQIELVKEYSSKREEQRTKVLNDLLKAERATSKRYRDILLEVKDEMASLSSRLDDLRVVEDTIDKSLKEYRDVEATSSERIKEGYSVRDIIRHDDGLYKGTDHLRHLFSTSDPDIREKLEDSIEQLSECCEKAMPRILEGLKLVDEAVTARNESAAQADAESKRLAADHKNTGTSRLADAVKEEKEARQVLMASRKAHQQFARKHPAGLLQEALIQNAKIGQAASLTTPKQKKALTEAAAAYGLRVAKEFVDNEFDALLGFLEVYAVEKLEKPLSYPTILKVDPELANLLKNQTPTPSPKKNESGEEEVMVVVDQEDANSSKKSDEGGLDTSRTISNMPMLSKLQQQQQSQPKVPKRANPDNTGGPKGKKVRKSEAEEEAADIGEFEQGNPEDRRKAYSRDHQVFIDMLDGEEFDFIDGATSHLWGGCRDLNTDIIVTRDGEAVVDEDGNPIREEVPMLNNRIWFVRYPHPPKAVVDGKPVGDKCFPAVDEEAMTSLKERFPNADLKHYVVCRNYRPNPPRKEGEDPGPSNRQGSKQGAIRYTVVCVVGMEPSTSGQLLSRLHSDASCSRISKKTYCRICPRASTNAESILNHQIQHHYRGVIACLAPECRVEQEYFMPNVEAWKAHMNVRHGATYKLEKQGTGVPKVFSTNDENSAPAIPRPIKPCKALEKKRKE